MMIWLFGCRVWILSTMSTVFLARVSTSEECLMSLVPVCTMEHVGLINLVFSRIPFTCVKVGHRM